MHTMRPAPMQQRNNKTSFPRGWYCVAETEQVTAQRLLPVNCLGQQFIAYRTSAGKAQLADAYCPHLGAHLASYDGALCDGRITCPFHHWQFDSSDGCVAQIPYGDYIAGTRALPDVQLKLHPTLEVDGMVLLWWGANGAPPDYEPFASLSADNTAWIPFGTKTFDVTAPFPDIMENIFDTAHVAQLHKSPDNLQIGDLELQSYGARLDFIGIPGEEPNPAAVKLLRCDFSGVTLMRQLIEADAFRINLIYSFTPIDAERTLQTTRFYLADMGSPALHDQITQPFMQLYTMQVGQDYQVLNFKKRLDKPRLCAGDGLIMRYRVYADKFYS